MTIYRLYVENGLRAGFWVQHRKWQNTCVQIQSIAGQESGALPGSAPLYDNAPVLVKGFDVRSGRPVDMTPLLLQPEDRNYARIAEPQWHHGRADRAALGTHA